MKAGINTLYTLLHYVLWHCKRIGKQVRQSLPKHLSETSTGATRCKYKINVCENFCRGCDFTKIQSSASKRNRFLVNDGRLFSSFNFGLMFSLVQAHSEDACWGTANDHHSCLPRNVRQPVEKKNERILAQLTALLLQDSHECMYGLSPVYFLCPLPYGSSSIELLATGWVLLSSSLGHHHTRIAPKARF